VNLVHKKSPFARLFTFVEVTYGATLGYCFLRIGETLKEFFVKPDRDPLASIGIRVCLELFVLDVLVHRFVESRLITTKAPYQNGNRFSIDVLMAGFVLMAFVAAEVGSAQLFAPLLAVFALWWLWAHVLTLEAGAFTSEYEHITAWAQGIAVVVCSTYYFYLAHDADPSAAMLRISWPGVGMIWSVYVIWLGTIFIFKRRKGLDWTEVTTLPIQWLLQLDDRGDLVLFSRRKNLWSVQFMAASAILGQFLFHLGWILATLEQGSLYSTARHDLSDLGALTAMTPGLWLIPQCIAGLTTIVFAVRVLGPTLQSRLGASLVTGSLMGIDNVSDALFRLPCQAAQAGCTFSVVAGAWMGKIHLIVALVSTVLSVSAPFALASEMSALPAWRDLARPTRIGGAALVILILAQLLLKLVGGYGAGYVQRGAALLMSVGIITLASRAIFPPSSETGQSVLHRSPSLS
jgi:hypothetical protein